MAAPPDDRAAALFDRFLAAIAAPPLRAVAEHWNAVRRGAAIPAWRDIDATALARQLPIIWSWRYDAAADRFTGRLAGEDIVAVVGTSIRGKPLEACFSPPAAKLVHHRYRTVAVAVQAMHSTGAVYIRAGKSGTGERIVLPLAEDGIHPDGVLGATVYRFRGKHPEARDISIGHSAEAVEFFPLREGAGEA